MSFKQVGFLITARLKSTRLPFKLMAEICGRPLISQMLNRVKQIRGVDKIVICTSTNSQDQQLVEIAEQEGVFCYRGSEEDVLLRLSNACEEYGLDYALNVTADCPLVDIQYAEKTLEAGATTGKDLVRSFELPHGLFCYGIRADALKRAAELKDSCRTEAWGGFFTDTTAFEVYDLPIPEKHARPEIRLTVDYPEDFSLVNRIFESLLEVNPGFGIDEILNLFEQNPELLTINQSRIRSYQHRIQSQTSIQLKPLRKVTHCGIIGCGSIGKRHLANCEKLGIEKYTALRSQENASAVLSQDHDSKEVFSLDELIARKPDFVIISNPSSQHLDFAKTLLPHVDGLFIEKPLHIGLDGIPDFLRQVDEHQVVTFVGYNLQLHPVIKQVESIVSDGLLGELLAFQCEVGHWLPDWHPNEDFRKTYFARPELGGGVTLTLAHELHLAYSLFGDVEKVVAFMPKSDSLELEVDVRSNVMLQHYGGMISQIHLDFLQKQLSRSGRVIGTTGQLTYDIPTGRVEITTTQGQQMFTFENADWNQMYLEELQLFVEYLETGRKRHHFDAWRGAASVAIAEAAFQSVANGNIAEMPQWVHEKGKGYSIGTFR